MEAVFLLFLLPMLLGATPTLLAINAQNDNSTWYNKGYTAGKQFADLIHQPNTTSYSTECDFSLPYNMQGSGFQLYNVLKANYCKGYNDALVKASITTNMGRFVQNNQSASGQSTTTTTMGSAQVGGFSTYTSNKFGYSIQYPSNWLVNENLDQNHVEIGPSDRSAFVLLITNSSVPANLTLEDVANKIVQTNLNSHYGKNATLIDKNTNNYFLAGNSAARVELTSKIFDPIRGQIQDRLLAFASIINGRLYSIVFATEDSLFPQYVGVFEHMVSSFSP
jgi:PsbP